MANEFIARNGLISLSTVTTSNSGINIGSTTTSIISDGSSIFIKASGNTYLNTANSAYVSAIGVVYGTNFSGPGTGLTGTATSLSIGGKSDGAIKLWSVSHPNDFYISNTWDGTYWQLTSNHGSAVNVGHATSAGTITGVYSGTITSAQVTTALGFTPYNSTNPNGYTSYALPLSGGTLSGSVTISTVNSSLLTFTVSANGGRSAAVGINDGANMYYPACNGGNLYLGSGTTNNINGAVSVNSSGTFTGSLTATSGSFSSGLHISSTAMFDLTDTNHGMIYNSTVDGPMFRGYAGFTWNTGSAGATQRMTLTAAGGLTVVGLPVTATNFSGNWNGYTYSASSGANTMVQRDGSGYISNNYFYTGGGGSERNATGMSYFAGFNSSDYYIRSYTPAAVASAIGLGSYLPLAGGTITGNIVSGDTSRNISTIGTYDSTKSQQIWSMGAAYLNSANGSTFGSLYGAAYKYASNINSVGNAGGHQFVWCQNGAVTAALGDGIWTSGSFTGSGSGLTGTATSLSIGGNAATIDSNPNRTDGTAYPVVWSNTGATSPNYSCAAVTIQSSTGTLQATTLRATSDVIAYYSDSRLKNNLGNITNALDKISKINGIYYTANELAGTFGYTEEQKQVGVIAQEIQAIMPEIIKSAPFDTNDDGTSKSGENYITVQYEKIVPLLIEGIKEQQKLIEDQQKQIKDQQKQIDSILSKL